MLCIVKSCSLNPLFDVNKKKAFLILAQHIKTMHTSEQYRPKQLKSGQEMRLSTLMYMFLHLSTCIICHPNKGIINNILKFKPVIFLLAFSLYQNRASIHQPITRNQNEQSMRTQTFPLLMNIPELVRTLLTLLFPDILSATADLFSSDFAWQTLQLPPISMPTDSNRRNLEER